MPARVRYEAESRRLVLMPEDDLKRGERYTVSITARTRDLAGNPLVAKRWSCTARR